MSRLFLVGPPEATAVIDVDDIRYIKRHPDAGFLITFKSCPQGGDDQSVWFQSSYEDLVELLSSKGYLL